ncbi:MAG: DNA polymerase, partial [Cyanobacteriota bacterium]
MTTATAQEEKPLLLLVDGHSLAFRSFYAFAKGGEGGLSTKDGVPTSVTYGFLKTLLDNVKGLNAKGVVLAFDTATPTFRHEADANYKAHRETAPEHFFADLANLQQILKEDLDLSLCLAPGYEADDVLGTLALRGASEGWRVRILSGDRDLFQLVDDDRDIAVLYMGGGPYAKNSGPIEMRREGVIAKLGVPPEDVIDLKALTGDPSDNIPGVKGVGPKTAINLLQAHGNLEGIFADLSQQKGALRTKLETGRDSAFHSRMLARILLDVPLEDPPRLDLGEVKAEALANSLEKLELFSLRKQVDSFARLFSAQPNHRPSSEAASQSRPTAAPTPNQAAGALSPEAGETSPAVIGPTPGPSDGPSDGPTPDPIPKLAPFLVQSPQELESLLQILWQQSDSMAPVALDTETTSLNPFRAELVGVGLAWGSGPAEVAYIPIAHQGAQASDLLSDAAPPERQLPLDQVLGALAPWLASKAHPKTLQNAKYDRLILMRHGLVLEGVVMDTLLADYLRDAGDKHGLEALAQRNFHFSPTSYSDLVAKGANFASVPLDQAAAYCGMDVHLTWRLTPLLRQQLADLGPALLPLLDQVELPLEPVLAGMEATGIRIDIPYLQELGQELGKSLAQLERDAHQAAGGEFNLASPKQLGEVLFDTLKLDRKKSRKTKTGWSTDAAVLEKLEA